MTIARGKELAARSGPGNENTLPDIF